LRSKLFNFLSICSTSNFEGSFNFERASLHLQRAIKQVIDREREREREKGSLKEGPAREKKKGSLIFSGRSFSRLGRFEIKNLKESDFGGFQLPKLRGKNK
jgi:hypothetical protein